jgi:predicted DNA-binding protein with PD1-like motif
LARDSFEIGSARIQRVLVAKIEPGEDLLKGIEAIAEKEAISSGVILSIVGSLRMAKLRNMKRFPARLPVSDEDRLYEPVEGPLEILSVSGNICRRADKAMHVHAHITLSKVVEGQAVVLGGHLIEGNETFVMVEVFIGVLGEGSFTRTMHPDRKSWEITPLR